MNENVSDTTVHLVRSSGADLIELVRGELALARDELRHDVDRIAGSAALTATSVLLGLLGVELVIGAMVAAGRRHPMVLASLGVACVGGAVSLGIAGAAEMRPILKRTRLRLAEDVSRIEESLR